MLILTLLGIASGLSSMPASVGSVVRSDRAAVRMNADDSVESTPAAAARLAELKADGADRIESEKALVRSAEQRANEARAALSHYASGGLAPVRSGVDGGPGSGSEDMDGDLVKFTPYMFL